MLVKDATVYLNILFKGLASSDLDDGTRPPGDSAEQLPCIVALLESLQNISNLDNLVVKIIVLDQREEFLALLYAFSRLPRCNSSLAAQGSDIYFVAFGIFFSIKSVTSSPGAILLATTPQTHSPPPDDPPTSPPLPISPHLRRWSTRRSTTSTSAPSSPAS